MTAAQTPAALRALVAVSILGSGDVWRAPITVPATVPHAFVVVAVAFALSAALLELTCAGLAPLRGWRRRPCLRASTASFAGIFVVAGLVQLQGSPVHIHHIVWIAALLAAGPSARTLRSASFVLALVYFFPGVHKLLDGGSPFFDGNALARLARLKAFEAGAAVPFDLDTQPHLLLLGGAFVIALELAMPLLAWKRPLFAGIAALALHVVFAFVFHMPYTVLALYALVFFLDAHTRRATARVDAGVPVDRATALVDAAAPLERATAPVDGAASLDRATARAGVRLDRATAPIDAASLDRATAPLDGAASLDRATARVDAGVPVDRATALVDAAAPLERATAPVDGAASLERATALVDAAAPLDRATAPIDAASLDRGAAPVAGATLLERGTFGVVVAGVVVAGALGAMNGYPFACYPTFAVPVPNTVRDARVDAFENGVWTPVPHDVVAPLDVRTEVIAAARRISSPHDADAFIAMRMRDPRFRDAVGSSPVRCVRVDVDLTAPLPKVPR